MDLVFKPFLQKKLLFFLNTMNAHAQLLNTVDKY